MRPLYVIKVGSSTLDRVSIFGELAGLVDRGARLLLVAGGAVGIERHFRAIGRRIAHLQMVGGDRVRYCPPAEIPHLVDAYEQVTLPAVAQALRGHGLSVFTSVAARDALVTGQLNRPLRVLSGSGRSRLVRDHRSGVPVHVDCARLLGLLDTHDVVCLSAPVADREGGTPLNVDADVLAAALSNALGADHLRLVTGTKGLLTDPADGDSTLRHAYPGQGENYAGGRMRQKVRAAEMALTGGADVAVTGPHTMADRTGWTRFWRAPAPAGDLTLLDHAVAVPSVSGDEGELAGLLVDWCAERGIAATIDEVGNLVAVKGDGPRRLLMLGHLDTVPFHWPVSWHSGELSGRGSVDAKGCLTSFLEVLATTHVPAGAQVRVVGAVEEEVSSSKGAFHVRDHYPADAVIVGEPSGASTLTLGYFGLFKTRITTMTPSGHSAGRDALSAADTLFWVLSDIRATVDKEIPDALSAVVDMHCEADRHVNKAIAVLNFRVPPGADPDWLREKVFEQQSQGAVIEILRATPGFVGGRFTTLAKAFNRAFVGRGIRARHVIKKGTSDMNTLATTWSGVPMVAYGPGDSTLDHTDTEHICADEYRTARALLGDAVGRWLVHDEGPST